MSAEFKIEGLADLEKQLLDFPEKIRLNVMRGALRAGARQIANEAKARVPVQTGQLRNSIRVSARLQGNDIVASVKAGGRVRGGSRKGRSESGAFYAHMVEFGTSAHIIQVIRAKALRVGGWFAHELEHPGARANPFFRAAISTKASAATQAVADYIRKRLDKLNQADNEG